MNIKDKIAIISGASSGLGAATTQLLTENGAMVFGLARNEQKLNGLKTRLGELFIPVSLDIANEKMVRQWVKNTFSNSHSPDILINNAGAGYLSTFTELTSVQWHTMVNTNLNGLYYLTSALVPLMKQKAASSHIINIGSILGKTTTNKSAGYSATKFAVQGLSEALAKELRNDGIKVSCINSGSIHTNFFNDSGIEPHGNMLPPEDIAKLIVQVLETPDNMLIDELTLRPLIPLKQPSGSELSSPVCYANSNEVRKEFREELLSGERKKAIKKPNDENKP